MSNFEDGADFADGFLSHWGVKGMKWGQRKRDSGDGGGVSKKEDDSEDFTRTADIAVKAKAGGIRTLSNKELQDLVTRINLEQNFNRINTPEAKKANPIKVGVDYVSGKVKKTADMTVDAILKTAVQIKVTEEMKKKMAAAPKVAA